MKRVLSLLLAAVITLSMSTVAFAAPMANPLGASGPYVMNATEQDKGSITSAVGVNLNKNDKFDVYFDKACFNWSTLGNGTYSFTNFNNAWIRLDGAVLGQDFAVAAVEPNTTNGSLKVQFQAIKVYSGTVYFYLNSNTTPTQKLSKSLNVSEPVSVMTGTASGKGGVVGPASLNSLQAGETFNVAFDKDSFNWAPNANGPYNLDAFQNSWVKLEGAVLDTDFSVSGRALDTATGKATVTLKALKGYSGTLKVYLNSGSGATNAYVKAATVIDSVSTIARTKSGGTTPVLTSHSGTNLSIVTGDTLTYSINADNFEWTSATGTKNAAALTDTSWIRLSGATLGTDFRASYSTPAGSSGEVRVTLTALKQGTYNSLRLNMQGGGGAATTSSAQIKATVGSSGSGKISGIASDAQIGGKYSGAFLNGKSISYSYLSALEVDVGDEFLIPFTAAFFTWDGQAPYGETAVTSAQLSAGKIKLSSSNKKGSKAFEEIKLVQQNGRAYLRVKFAKDNVGTKDLDFEANLYLTVNGTRHTGSYLPLSGTLVQKVEEVWSGEDYYDISDGTVLEPQEYVRNIELYLGAGVTMYVNLNKGTKYSGTAKAEISSQDERIIDKYPSIEEVIVLNTVNLNKASNKVTFTDYDKYHVYNADGKYLGLSTEKLPYSKKYYLSSKKITMEEIGTAIEEDDYIDAPLSSGNATEAPPVNGPKYDNPGTGRPTAYPAIVTIGILEAGTAFLTRKKTSR